MKKLIVTAGALVIGLSTAMAQQGDTTRHRDQSKRMNERTQSDRNRDQQNTDQARHDRTMNQSKGQPSDQGQQPQRRDMEIVQASEIPAALRQTLQDPKYKGWEDAIIYHNTRTDEYLVSPRPHRFTSEGKEVEYGKMGYGRHDRTQGKYGNKDEDQSMNDRQRSDRDGTNPTQDSTRTNRTRPTQPTEQERAEQSRSYRQDSTGMNSYRQDSTGMNRNRSSSDSSQSGSRNPNNSYTSNRISDQNVPTEGMVLVEQNDLPQPLVTTLRDSDYSGWQQGKIYHNVATDEYLLIMGGESGENQQRTFRFNKEGKLLKNKNDRGQQ